MAPVSVPQARYQWYRGSVPGVKVAKEDARRFFVARQLLAPARSLADGPDGVLEVLRRLGSIQLDPVDVAGRSHDLVLHARVADYDPGWCDELYKRREIVEAYNKGLSLVPASEYAWFRVRRSYRWQKVLDDNEDVAKQVLERIRAEGPLSSLDFERESGPTKDWFGAPMNAVRAVLDAYARIGVLGIAKREGNHRQYDLPERFLPAEVLAHDLTLHEQLRHKMLSRYRAHGLVGASGHGEGIFEFLGPANPDPRYPGFPGRNALREELVELGELIPVEVEGVSGKRYVVRDDVELLRAPPEPPPSVAFISPTTLGLGPQAPREPVRLRLRLGAVRAARQAPLGLVRPADRLWRPPRRQDRAAHRPRRRHGAGSRPLVGGRLPAAPGRGVRRGDARGASRLSPLRKGGPHRLAIRARHEKRLFGTAALTASG